VTLFETRRCVDESNMCTFVMPTGLSNNSDVVKLLKIEFELF